MTKKPTVAGLQREIASLKVYEEAWFCREDRCFETEIQAEPYYGRDTAIPIVLLGGARASGGVVLVGGIPIMAEEWIRKAESDRDPYVSGAAREVRRAQQREIEAKSAARRVSRGVEQ